MAVEPPSDVIVGKNIQNNIKTLVILMGNARGGEETWQSMYKYLLDPFSADLALLFGKTNDKSSSLYNKAKYLWEIDEYSNWREYYENNVVGCWNNFFNHFSKGLLAGGIDNFKGSGAILLALRHFLNNNYKKILLKYERIILTRPDYFYLNYHPVLSNNYFYIPEGEDYGGICDRHHVFPTHMANEVLGVVEFFSDIKNYNYLKNIDLSNIERLLFEFYQHNNIIKNIKRFNRVQFTVTSNNDHTRWRSGRGYLFGSKSLQIKYQREYYSALKNKYGLVIGLFLRFIFHFFKKN
jgi:hypothetical protein